jgi:hypothetical protein
MTAPMRLARASKPSRKRALAAVNQIIVRY